MRWVCAQSSSGAEPGRCFSEQGALEAFFFVTAADVADSRDAPAQRGGDLGRALAGGELQQDLRSLDNAHRLYAAAQQLAHRGLVVCAYGDFLRGARHASTLSPSSSDLNRC